MLIHKNSWAAVLFWIGIVWLKWQIAVAIFVLFFVSKKISKTKNWLKELQANMPEESAYIGDEHINTEDNNWGKGWRKPWRTGLWNKKWGDYY